VTNIRRTGGLVALAMVGLTACGPTLGSLPLPGKGVSGGHDGTINVTMEFDDALNLAQGAPVKVNGVDAGKVQKIEVKDYHAQATIKLRRDAQLNMGTGADVCGTSTPKGDHPLTARLRYTTPLGELYVDVTNGAGGNLVKDGQVLPASVTCTAPTVEDALSQAGLLINGGGLGSIQTISTELKHAFVGKEPVWRDLIGRLNTTVTQANGTTKDFDAALTALNGLSVTLGKNREVINRALKDIAPAAAVLKSQAPNITQLLVAVQGFATQANQTLAASKGDLLTTLSEVQPVLQQFVNNKAIWTQSLDSLAVFARSLQRVVPGDFANIGGELLLNNSLIPGVTNLPVVGGILGQTPGTGGTTTPPKNPLPIPLPTNLLPSSGSSSCVPILNICL
jgi:phospholipid/cholesterol/gamma-HCH transport system substrate-binding protein